MDKRLLWRFAGIHLVVIVIITAILLALFAPTARLFQQIAGELEPPERYSTAEEARQWEIYLERGYGEGVNTVTNLLFFSLGVLSIGVLSSYLILPQAMRKDPGMDPTDILLPTCTRSIGMGALLVLLASLVFGQAASELEQANWLTALGPAAVGLFLLPAFAFAFVGMAIGIKLWKRSHHQALGEDDTVRDFYRRRLGSKS